MESKDSIGSIYVPGYFDYRKHYNQKQLSARCSYWFLLYDHVTIHVEHPAEIVSFIGDFGLDAIRAPLESGRLKFAFDPSIGSSIQPRRNDWGEVESILTVDFPEYNIHYGGVAQHESGLILGNSHFLQKLEKMVSAGELPKTIMGAFRPLFQSDADRSETPGASMISAINSDLKGRIASGLKTDIERDTLILREAPALRSLVDFGRHVCACRMGIMDVDLDFLHRCFSAKVQRRLSSYFDQAVDITPSYYDRKRGLESIRKLNGCPSVYSTILSGSKSVSDFLRISESADAAVFREWLTSKLKSGADINVEFVNNLREVVKVTGSEDWLGWGTQNAIGLVPVVGNIISAAWSGYEVARQRAAVNSSPLVFVNNMLAM